ncbi:CLUMA_CG006359, isoform A [Clunio marinus]|uniref:CLUMA_CG006359, isoform A n=1 Tax=Clunio marinus TaxID=568069 RepID=A0A1J1HXH8_9DIPT|nr:CLUMA_CG006359, isoform A [Clunio marinus]
MSFRSWYFSIVDPLQIFPKYSGNEKFFLISCDKVFSTKNQKKFITIDKGFLLSIEPNQQQQKDSKYIISENKTFKDNMTTD